MSSYESQQFFAFLMAIAAFFAIFGVIIYVITSWFMMKLFDKAGVQGRWRAWVPVYREMIFLKLGDLSPWLILYAMGATLLIAWTGIGSIISIAIGVVMVMAAWRIGLKLQKEGAWAVLYFFLAPVWLGILAFDSSRWNANVVPASWAANGFLADRTVWNGVPVQTSAAAPGYGAAPQGYYAPPQGYQPGQAYAPQPPYGAQQPPYDAPQPSYGTAQPPYGAPQPPAPGGPQIPDAPTPPAAPGQPPAAPSVPGAPGTPPVPPVPPVPPAPGTDPNQPPV